MNFVKAETLVQEITADGKVRDIVTTRVKTQAEKEAEQREEIIRNLPEFQRNRGEGKGLAEQMEARDAREADEEKAALKEYNVHTIDDDEYEHYQHLEVESREKVRKQVADDASAVASFENERKRLRQDPGDAASQDVLSSIQQQARERAAARAKAGPTAADRLRGRITVKAKAGGGGEESAAPPEAAAAAGTGGGGLVGYASDSDS
mmetsp:Transcript_105004/g.306811  ORF Transcript_105004/g.306811 Transcript_105004/m.306811 type:complete len:207 (+) Transcript_105004:106-726(+)